MPAKGHSPAKGVDEDIAASAEADGDSPIAVALAVAAVVAAAAAVAAGGLKACVGLAGWSHISCLTSSCAGLA